MRLGKSRVGALHGWRTVTLRTESVRVDPYAEIKKAIWRLIHANCNPPRRVTGFHGGFGKNQVENVTVQTFYVTYPHTPELVNVLGGFDDNKIAKEIIEEMVGFDGQIFEPYLRNKIGETTWEQARKRDEQSNSRQDRVDSALNIRLVEVLTQAVPRGPVRVVGRESLIVEIERLKKLGKVDPKVTGVIDVGGIVNINPHLREYQKSASERRSRNREIPILEGRNASVFVVGSHVYDDIEVIGMSEEEGYLLTVFSTFNQAIMAELRDVHGEKIEPQTRDKLDPKYTWRISRSDRGKAQWSCRISITRYSTSLSSYALPGIPPSIHIVGRVLPAEFLPGPVNQALRNSGLQADLLACASGIALEDGLFLYAVHQEGSAKVYLKNDADKKVEVVNSLGQPASNTDKGFQIADRSVVTIDGLHHDWRLRSVGTVSLPEGVIGLLEYRNKIQQDPMEVPDYALDTVDGQRADPAKWMIGAWKRGTRAAVNFGCTPLLVKNPDPFLSASGNLAINYSGPDAQGRPLFTLSLKQTVNRLPFIVKSSQDADWRTIGWPDFGDDLLKDIPGVQIVGESNDLIFGTSYYRIKTSGTLI